MERKWTDAQLAAIQTRNKDLLISAAAGSGKTATLTERIIRSLTDTDSPSDISRMLIVTFTKAAAAELRHKIFKALTEALAKDPQNRHLASQLLKVGNAKICTIDAFYLDLIKENFSEIGLPPSFRIADTAETEILEKEIMTDTVSRFYDADTDAFSRFAEGFVSVRSAHQLPDVFLNLYSHISAYPEGIEFLTKCEEDCRTATKEDFFESSFGKILQSETADNVEYFISVLSDLNNTVASSESLSPYYLPSFAYDLSFCKGWLKVLSEVGYKESREYAMSYSPIKLSSLPKGTADEFSESLRARRLKITKAISTLASRSFALPPESISRALDETAAMISTLHALLLEFEKKLNEEKLQRGVFDFNDIRRFVLLLLTNEDGSPSDTAKAISSRYSDIYIDEYQDVDRVQDMIFKSISNGKNRFMVGDIKQSIYGFRGAEPHVFAGYRRDFPMHTSEEAENSDNASIFMSNNFRCDKSIIDFTNTVCSYLFGICAQSIGYTRDDDLVFSKLKPSDDYISQKVELDVIVPPLSDDFEYEANADNNRECEARFIAAKISELISHGKKADGNPITPSDIAILFRSGKMKLALRRAFDEAGIAYSGAEDDKYFENPDVLLVLSLLNVIDNPHRDIYLAAVLYSPLFNFSMEELIRLRLSADTSCSLFEALSSYSNDDDTAKKCVGFISLLERWRDLSLSTPVDKLIRHLYSSSEFAMAGIEETENLRVLYEYARRFEASAFKGLFNFIEYVNRLISEGKKINAESTESAPDKVSLMTIHHSKGLEFPVCFICGASGEFNREDFKDSLLFEYSAGVAMKLPDTTGFARVNTPMREAVASKLRGAQIEEEMRVLYVAMTRAREKLFITASSSKTGDRLLGDAEEARANSGRYTLMKASSYLEWILAAISGIDVQGCCDLCFIPVDKIPAAIPPAASPSAASEVTLDKDKLREELQRKFSFVYPYASLSRIPAKISVSRLYPDVLDENESAYGILEARRSVPTPAVFSDGAEITTPSPSERGTATHLFMQFCDFERAKKNGVAEELALLIEKGFLPASARGAVFTEELERFFESDLFEKISGAQRIYRERRFNILLPPSMFSSDEKFIEQAQGEMLAVQGVIDLVIIDAEGRLCLYDYKTDRLSRSELESDALLKKKMKTLHAEQLSYYKLAVEQLFERKCDTVEIYSTCAAKTVNIDL